MMNVQPFKTAFIAGRIHNHVGIIFAFGSCDKIKTARKIIMEIIQINRL